MVGTLPGVRWRTVKMGCWIPKASKALRASNDHIEVLWLARIIMGRLATWRPTRAPQALLGATLAGS